MTTLYDRISALCESRGIKGGKMCTDTGISKGLLTDLKMGRRTGISAVTALKIAEYFGITVDELYGREPLQNKENPGIPKDTEVDPIRAELLNLIEGATEEQCQDYLDMLRIVLNRREKR